MQERLTRLEVTSTELQVQFGRIEEKLDSILHWMHNGGNPGETEKRVRHLEQWRSFTAGVVALASIVFTVALVVLGGR